MVRRVIACVVLIVTVAALVGCQSTIEVPTPAPTPEAIKIGIHKTSPASDFGRGKLETLPEMREVNGVNQVDLRGYDLSGLSLDKVGSSLLRSDFDSVTKWPQKLPSEFDPDRIMELGKDPGLGVRSLHERGVTGKGVSIAIIDQCLLVDHEEYKEQLRHYEEIHSLREVAAMHGAAVASIAVGKTVGVAPNAELYYIAETHGEIKNNTFEWDFTWLAQSLDRIIEINEQLPKENKIRVVSMSIGWSPEQKGYSEIEEAVRRAKAKGIFVVSSSLSTTYNDQFFFHGLGRDPYKDPNAADSYVPGCWWADQFYRGQSYMSKNTLLIPMDARCTASPTGQDDYVFYTQGGWSWSIPYIAGSMLWLARLSLTSHLRSFGQWGY